MFDDLVIDDRNNGECEESECERPEPETVPDPNANVKRKTQGSPGISGTSGGPPTQGYSNGGSSVKPQLKKIHTISGTAGQQIQQSVPSAIPSAVILDFNLAKVFMLDCFLKDSALENSHLIKIADMIEFATSTQGQGLNIQNQMDRLKIAEMILSEIFY